MKLEKISLITNAVLFLLLLTAIVYAFVQQAEAKRQTEVAQRNAEHAVRASTEADLCRREAMALQAEAERQRQLAEMHRIELDRALAACKGK